MNREQLKELGLTDEQIEEVMKAHGKSDNEYKEKAEQVDTLQSQIDDYKGQIAERDTQLEDVSEKAKGNEELTAQLDELKQLNEQTKTDYENKLNEQAFYHKLDNTLTSATARNTKALKTLLDLDIIKLEDGELKGLNEQPESLQKEHDYLFEQEEKPSNSPQIVNPGNPQGNGTGGNDDPFAAKLAKYNEKKEVM